MNAAQLEGWVAANKPAVLGVGAAAVVGLGLYKRRTAKSSPGAAAGQAATPAGLSVPYSAGGQAASVGGTYDSSASDLYGVIGPQLESIGNAVRAQQAPPTPVPAGVSASGLFAPSNTGNYVRYGDGTIAEVQQDGSLLGLSYSQWVPLATAGARYADIPGATPQISTTWGNLTRVNTPPTPAPAPAGS